MSDIIEQIKNKIEQQALSIDLVPYEQHISQSEIYKAGANFLLPLLEKAVIALKAYEGESIETDEGHCFFADNAMDEINNLTKAGK